MNIQEIESFISPGRAHKILDPAGKHISLSRFGAVKYLAKGELSPLGLYSNFQLWGVLKLEPTAPATPKTCKASLSMKFTAYHWSPLLVVEGSGVHLHSKSLERGYLDGIALQHDQTDAPAKPK